MNILFRYFYIVLFSIASISLIAQPRKQELRGMWIANVGNVDWPSAKGLSPQEQQAELIAYLDMAQELNLNAVFFQVRNACDAVYESRLEPWSEWLTGTQGQSPGYDPLAFLIEEARKRNIEVHAWLNPYRAVTDIQVASIHYTHVSKVRPDVLLAYGNLRILNPGLPEVRAFVNRVVIDIVKRYDVAGIHFDDYFYPYPQKNASLNDYATFKTYNRGFTNIADWRRDNVNLLIKSVSDSIRSVKQGVKFGVSPFGIWQNNDSSNEGSESGGLESYKSIYADSRKWVAEGWVDYILPQLYWSRGNRNADFTKLLSWWSQNATNSQLYIGHAAYKVGGGETGWQNPNELIEQVKLARRQAQGSVFFSAKSLKASPLGIKEALKTTLLDNSINLPPTDDNKPIVLNQNTSLRAVQINNSNTVSSSTDKLDNPPADELYMQVFPNPFNQQVNIRYRLKEVAQVSVYVYDVKGTRVGVLVDNQPHPIGEYVLKFNGQFLEDGTYFTQIIANNKQKRVKMVLKH